MDFQQFGDAWKRSRTRAQRLALAAAEWFNCCQAWVRGGQAPQAGPGIEQIIAVLGPVHRSIARAHLECAKLALNSQWTSGTGDSNAFRSLHAQLFSPDLQHLPVAFLRDLTDALLGNQRRKAPSSTLVTESTEARRPRTALFPLVPEGAGVDSPGTLAQFVLERLEGGEGQVFLDPRQAFLELDSQFRAVFHHAPQVLRDFCGCQPTGDVRVRIETFPGGKLFERPLGGNSAGGALALGLWSVWTGTPLMAGYVTSFALTAPPADDPNGTSPHMDAPDGKCHPIGGDIIKARDVADKKGG